MNFQLEDANQLSNFNIFNLLSIPTHKHSDIELLFLLKGKLKITIDNEIYHLQKEDIIVINSSQEHSINAEPDSLYFIMHINYVLLAKYLSNSKIFFLCNSTITNNNNVVLLQRLLKDLLQIEFDNQNYKTLSLQKLSFQIVEILIQHFSVTLTNQHSINFREIEFDNYIQANYSNQLKLSDLAEVFHLSPNYISKYFKEKLGTGFYDYLNNIRLAHATKNLLHSQDSITTIALNNGFPNSNSFTKVFKEHNSMTPHEYRKKYAISNTKSDNNQFQLNSQLKEVLNSSNTLLNDELHDILEVDDTIRTTFNYHWKKLINLGEASTLLTLEVQSNIKFMKKKLGFEYGRIWNIFLTNNEMDFDYYHIERSLDFLMENNIKPFIVIDSSKLPDSSNTVQFENYISLIELFIKRIINRYGINQVIDWYFEITCDFSSPQYRANSFTKIFNTLHQIFLKYAYFKIGGGGIPLDIEKDELNYLLKEWTNFTSKPSFVTFHTQNYLENLLNKKEYSHFLSNYNLQEKLEELNISLKLYDLNVETFISLWDYQFPNLHFLNDTSNRAAFIIKEIISSYGKIDGIGYFHAFDLSSSKPAFYGGKGLLNNKGIPKPSFYAYTFLNIGKGRHFLGKDCKSIISTDGVGNYFIVTHNFKEPNYQSYVENEQKNKENVAHLFQDTSKLHLTYKLNNIRNGTYKVKIQYINEQEGNIAGEWEKLNSIENLSPGEREYLQNVCVPRLKIFHITVSENTLELYSDLLANEIQSIRIVYQYN